MKHKKRNTFRAFYPLLIICLTAVIICTCGIVRELNTYRQGRNYYTALSDGMENQKDAEEVQFNAALGINDTKSGTDEKQISIFPEQSSNLPEQSILVPEDLFYMDFKALQESIPDIVAWIRCQGTVIDYPIVQGTDNDYYLKHLPNQTSSKMGSIFLDYNNVNDFSDYNSVIYGHHMRSGDMFSILDSYREQSFYDEHPVIELYTPDHNYILELYAGYVADAKHETIPLAFGDVDEYMQYIFEIQERSAFKSNVVLEKEDRLVSLCTCTSSSSDARFIIVAKLTEAKNPTE